MRIFGPFVWPTTLPSTDTLASLARSVVTSAAATRSAGNESSAPGSPASFSTSTMSPTATLYCLPPVLTIAYIGTELSCYSMVTGHAPNRLRETSRGGTRQDPSDGGPQTRLREWVHPEQTGVP